MDRHQGHPDGVSGHLSRVIGLDYDITAFHLSADTVQQILACSILRQAYKCILIDRKQQSLLPRRQIMQLRH